MFRLVEYGIRCDNTDCCAEVLVNSKRTVADATEDALQHGWKRAGKRRWLCPECAKDAERLAERRKGGAA